MKVVKGKKGGMILEKLAAMSSDLKDWYGVSTQKQWAVENIWTLRLNICTTFTDTPTHCAIMVHFINSFMSVFNNEFIQWPAFSLPLFAE